MLNRDELIQMLRDNEAVELEFTKADGSLRRMKATRNGKVLEKILGTSEAVGSKEDIDAKHNNITVFDLEKQAFRCFNVLRLKKIEPIE